MFRLRITTGTETVYADLPPGLTELGRGPERDGLRRITLFDPTVSRDHLRMTPQPPDRVWVENLSGRFPVRLGDGGVIPTGDSVTLAVPAVLVVGETRLDLIVAPPGPAPAAETRRPVVGATQAIPYPPRTFEAETTQGPSLSVLDIQPAALADVRTTALPNVLAGPPEGATLARWFEAITAVQTAPPGSAEFYQQAADAVVELIGMHTGIVLLGEGPDWQPVARASRSPDREADGPEYSTSILRRVCEDRRTVFHANAAASRRDMTQSLVNVGAAVASPILAADGRVLGVLYGSRPALAAGRGLSSGGVGPLEAHAVQLLATTVGIGLDRVADEERAVALRAEKEAAEVADRAKGQFLALVSHELRTPLTAILGYAELLIETATEDGAGHLVPDLRHIHTAGTSLLTIIDDLLDLSKIEAGQFAVSPEPFALAEVLADACRTARPLMAANGNGFEADLSPDLGDVILDPARVRQCVLNLLGNAAKFTRNGVVRLTAARFEDRVRVGVIDTGIGIPADRLAALFRPFAQADASIGKKYGGTGLGLAICRRLCQLMGGDVTASSEPGRGSVFTIELPVVVGGAE